MNQNRRKQIDEALEAMQNSLSVIETLRDEEEEYFDSIPDNMKEGERAAQSEAAVQNLSDAVDSLQSAVDSLESME